MCARLDVMLLWPILVCVVVVDVFVVVIVVVVFFFVCACVRRCVVLCFFCLGSLWSVTCSLRYNLLKHSLSL